jgi:hypothetical protein
MNSEALPYTLLILLAEFTIGCLWLVWWTDLRGAVISSFVRFSAAMCVLMAAFTLIVARQIDVPALVDGYPLDTGYAGPTRVALAVLLGLLVPYAISTLIAPRRVALALGGVASLAGLVALAIMSQVFALPAWGYAGVFASLVIGALAVGGVSMGMILGHWYLVTPRLPEQPLREVTVLLMVALALQLIILLPNVALPHDHIPATTEITLGLSPFFWMRIAGGIAFPLVLTYMAYDSSGIRAMQSATGLLYLAMALVLSGEVLAKALMLATGVPG